MKTLSTIEEWKQVKQQSFQKPQVIYIHSLPCPISTVTIRRMANSAINEARAEYWYCRSDFSYFSLPAPNFFPLKLKF